MKNKLVLLILKELKIVTTGLIAGFILFLVYALFFYVPMYSLNSKIFIKNLVKQRIVTDYDGRTSYRSESGYSNPLFNFIQIFRSQMLAEKIYNELNKKYPDDLKKLGVKNKDGWYRTYLNLMKVKIEPSTDIMNIKMSWPVKKNTYDVINIVINTFRENNLEISNSIDAQQSRYINKQLVDIGSQLDLVRKKIKNYKVSNGIADIDSETIELTRSRVDLEKQAQILKSNLAFNNRKLAEYANQLNMPDAETALRATGIGEDPYLVRLNQDLASVKQKYSMLAAKFTDEYPEVQSVKSEIDQIQQNIQKREQETLSNLKIARGIYDKPSQDIATDLARVQAESLSMRAQLKALNRGIGNLRGQEARLPGKKMGLDDLTKQESALALAYEAVKRKQMEAKIKEGDVVDNIFPLGMTKSPASTAIKVLFVKFVSFMMLGLLGALGFVYIKEDIEDKWRDSQEIEDITGKKVLGTLPWVKSKEDSKGFIFESDTIMGMAYGNIANSIIGKSYLEEASVLSFAATAGARAKSSIIPNIAYNISKFNRSVLLIDTNFNHPLSLLEGLGIHQHAQNDIIYFLNEVNKEIRLNKSISQEKLGKLLEESIIPVSIKSKTGENITFHYLCSSKPIENIYDYVGTKAFEMLIGKVKSMYEFVLIDTPAKPYIYPEIKAVTNKSDAVAIISAMESNREELVKMIAMFNKTGVKVLGVIPREINSELERFFYQSSQRVS